MHQLDEASTESICYQQVRQVVGIDILDGESETVDRKRDLVWLGAKMNLDEVAPTGRCAS
ncbi:MAG: hypothetical protein ACUVR8_04825 [Acidobacteriota bacterium]